MATHRRSSARQTLSVMAATLLSRLLGFARLAIIAGIFGAAGEADVLHLVFNIPNNLRKLMAEGALSSAFIPVLSARAGNSAVATPTTVAIVRRLLALQWVVWLPLLAASVAFAQPIVDLILDFPDAAQRLLAARLFRLMINYSLLIGIVAILMGTLNSHDRFFVPALTPTLFSICVIGAILIWHDRLGVYSMAVGVLAGGLCQIAFQVPLCLKLGYNPLPGWGETGKDFGKIMRRWAPVVATSSVFIINQQVAIFFASGLAEGSGSAISNAVVFWQLPFGIFGASIITVQFPAMSRAAGDGNLGELRSSIAVGMRRLFGTLAPSALLLGMLAHEVIAVALQRGAFQSHHTDLAARTLVAYCWGLFSVGAFTFLQRVFYACGDYRSPILLSIVTVTLDIVLSLWLKETSLGVAGLAAANSIAFSFGLAMGLIWLSRSIGGIGWGRAPILILKVVGALAPAAIWLLLFGRATGEWWLQGSTLSNMARLSVAGGGAVALILLCYWLLGLADFGGVEGRRR